MRSSMATSYSPTSMAAHGDVEESERDDSVSDWNPNTELSSSIWDKRSEPRLKRMRSGMLKTQPAVSPFGSVTPTPEEEHLAHTCLELLKQPSISPISPRSNTEVSFDEIGKDSNLDYVHTHPVPEQEEEIPVHDPAHACDDQKPPKDLNADKEIPAEEPAHAGDAQDSFKDLNAEEKEKHLQTIAFDELVEVLQVSNPQHTTLSKLEPYADTLYTPKTYERMSIALGPVFDQAYEAMQLWHAIHRKLKEFRETTKYEGKAGADWQAYKQALRSVSWKESLPAMTAHRQLGLFVEEMKKRGEWFASSEGFADDLARFYAALLLPPNISAEDLVGGFEEYNVELLKWFEAGG
ncbi:hypothetical protein J4E93_008738 [Alternaria ventricosa]|uniref:uncharacterized protein n=1 Tax=Alternaria ventricosa TaxID=1187951 RepID=UPI0020C4F6F9|nr:uncharacterized protein J4E93_008738 [Alternaria ventricosa]KAI4639939.1 hypothetical protein J4E93_008738 [Alternaria ventricosa]